MPFFRPADGQNEEGDKVSLLEKVHRPSDIKGMDEETLRRLAREIRRYIIQVVSQNGGHLAPNLGVVELTLALHHVFDMPKDKIVWDVGHQCYTHKIITGRNEAFTTLRTLGGISGFPRPAESEYDVAVAGHASTSVSAALGLAVGRDLAGQDHQVVAVIGDGSLTGGMAFEALNHAGDSGTRLIVVLNDNRQSIAPNVGALSSYLGRLRTSPTYNRVKSDIELVLGKIPAVGKGLATAFGRVKDSLKYLVVPGIIFEELGFTYLGPVDGHDLGALIDVFKQAKHAKGPVLVHVVTVKGRGYPPAERDPAAFHGVGPFSIATGQGVQTKGVTYSRVFGEALCELAAKDERIVALTAAMTDGTGLSEFESRYPGRFFDVGIAEQHAVTFAAGLASSGLRPVVAIYSTFLQRAYDQVVHDVCIPGLPVVFCLDRAGLVGEDGPTHHGAFDIAYLRHVPGMTLMAPADGVELAAMLRRAIDLGSPVAIRYPRGSIPEPLSDSSAVNIERAELVRDGDACLIVAVGPMVYTALEAASALSNSGIEVAVLNVRWLKPLDAFTLDPLLRRFSKVVTLEEGSASGGFGSALLEFMAERDIRAETRILGLPDTFVGHGKRDELLVLVGLTPDGVARSVAQFVTQGKYRSVRRAGAGRGHAQ
ncbi:MAG: 1-deoxy-D-xylulose-5-phosphate synthase [Bacillota bacterium]